MIEPAPPADLAALAVTFGELVHAAGVPVTPERSGRFARAINLVSPATTDDLYWAARVTLVTQHAHLDTFDRVFARVFAGLGDVADRRGDWGSVPVRTRSIRQPALSTHFARSARPAPLRGGSPSAGRQPAGERDDEGGEERHVVLGLAGSEERLATTDFGDLDEQELADLQQLMRSLRISPPMRVGRRARRHPHGERLDLRATLRHSRRTGGDPLVQVRRRRQPRPRRVVLLCDISGSMEPYARAYVQFLHAAAGSSRAEVFTFATRLTRLTRALSVAQPAVALARAAAAAPDWRGGTRIGEALRTFLDGYGRRGLARQAVIVIVSDGWERDDPALLGEQMARLRLLAHRIVWVNPRSAHAGYQPLAGGMAAAIPHCDALVSGHSLAALRDVIAAIAAP